MTQPLRVAGGNGWKRPSSPEIPSCPSSPSWSPTTRPACRHCIPRVVSTIRSPHGGPPAGSGTRSASSRPPWSVGTPVPRSGLRSTRVGSTGSPIGMTPVAASAAPVTARPPAARQPGEQGPPAATGPGVDQRVTQLRQDGHRVSSLSRRRRRPRPRLTRWRMTASETRRSLAISAYSRSSSTRARSAAASCDGSSGEPGFDDRVALGGHQGLDQLDVRRRQHERLEADPAPRGGFDAAAPRAAGEHVASDPEQPHARHAAGTRRTRRRPPKRPRTSRPSGPPRAPDGA